MVKQNYKSALVIGKFMPLHKGHTNLINFARQNAQNTVVLVLGHDNEYIPLQLREKWMNEEYQDKPNMFIYGVSYNENELNSSSESDKQSSIEWSEYLKRYINMHGIDVIIGSERYVQYMAEYLGINYIIYDEKRQELNISATNIRNNIITNWDYLVPSVKRYFAKHVCICGSESSGKTTACRKLEDTYEFVTMIPEIGRCLVGNAMTCSMETLFRTFNIHKELLEKVILDPPTPIIVWDTDNITTLSYFRMIFKQDMFIVQDSIPKAHQYFFFKSIIPYKKDVSRVEENVALELAQCHLETYKKHHIHPVILEDFQYEHVSSWVEDTITQIATQISGEIKLNK